MVYNLCRCFTGKPTRPHIFINEFSDSKVVLTCQSSCTTILANHVLPMVYSWKVNGVINPIKRRYLYSETGQNLTIYPAKKEDALKSFVCYSREEVIDADYSEDSNAASISHTDTKPILNSKVVNGRCKF